MAANTNQAAAPASPAAAPQPPTTDAPVAPTRPAAGAKPTVAPPVPAQTATAKVTKPTAATPASAGRFTVQLGAFSSRVNAATLLAKARSAASDGRIVASSAGGKSVFRVVTGSFATQAQANAHAAALKKSPEKPNWLTITSPK